MSGCEDNASEHTYCSVIELRNCRKKVFPSVKRKRSNIESLEDVWMKIKSQIEQSEIINSSDILEHIKVLNTLKVSKKQENMRNGICKHLSNLLLKATTEENESLNIRHEILNEQKNCTNTPSQVTNSLNTRETFCKENDPNMPVEIIDLSIASSQVKTINMQTQLLFPMTPANSNIVSFNTEMLSNQYYVTDSGHSSSKYIVLDMNNLSQDMFLSQEVNPNLSNLELPLTRDESNLSHAIEEINNLNKQTNYNNHLEPIFCDGTQRIQSVEGASTLFHTAEETDNLNDQADSEQINIDEVNHVNKETVSIQGTVKPLILSSQIIPNMKLKPSSYRTKELLNIANTQKNPVNLSICLDEKLINSTKKFLNIIQVPSNVQKDIMLINTGQDSGRLRQSINLVQEYYTKKIDNMVYNASLNLQSWNDTSTGIEELSILCKDTFNYLHRSLKESKDVDGIDEAIIFEQIEKEVISLLDPGDLEEFDVNLMFHTNFQKLQRFTKPKCPKSSAFCNERQDNPNVLMHLYWIDLE